MRALWRAVAVAAAPAAVRAHEGHAMPGLSHWHASDAGGLLLVVGVALAALWWGRRK